MAGYKRGLVVLVALSLGLSLWMSETPARAASAEELDSAASSALEMLLSKNPVAQMLSKEAKGIKKEMQDQLTALTKALDDFVIPVIPAISLVENKDNDQDNAD